MALAELLERSTETAPLGSIVGAVSRIARTPALALALAACAVGCAGSDAGDQPVLTTISASSADPKIFDGVRDDDSQAVKGVVALRVGAAGTFELCSGALLAPNVVLTARHCVTRNYTTSVSCDQDGRSANGPHVIGDQDPVNVGVYVGASPSFSTRPLAVAKAIIAPKGQFLCDSDIALVVLATPIDGIAPMAVRLEVPAQPGETIRSVGYGQNDDKLPIGNRFRKTGVEVLAQGKAISKSRTPLGQHEFEVGKSICQGDSGGPAISEDTGAVIGVVSRGGGCDDDFGHIYTTTAGFSELFDEAFAVAGAKPTLETGGPHPTSASPQDDSSAPDASHGGCSAAPSSTRTTYGAALGLLLAAGLVLRTRRR
jgi:MYXO-CTERM domain-containing protein